MFTEHLLCCKHTKPWEYKNVKDLTLGTQDVSLVAETTK